MNENLLVVLLAVIIFVLIVIAGMAINIAFDMRYLEKIALRLNVAIDDLDLLIARADTVIAHFDDEDEHSKSISNKLDAVIANQDEIENEIHDDSSLISRWYAKCKDLKERRPDDGVCRDCMFVFKPYYEEPCNKCSHGYGSKFVSRRNKE